MYLRSFKSTYYGHTVTVEYEVEGYKPLYVEVIDEEGDEVSFDLDPHEYDRFYEEACANVYVER